MNYKTSMER